MVNPLRLRCNHIFCDACISEWCERLPWLHSGLIACDGQSGSVPPRSTGSGGLALGASAFSRHERVCSFSSCALEAAGVEAAARAAPQAPGKQSTSGLRPRRLTRERTCPMCRAIIRPPGVHQFDDGATSLYPQLF